MDLFDGFHAGWYGLFAILYSAVVLRREVSFRKPYILPGRCAQPVGATAAIHLCYLGGLLALYRLFVSFDPRVPKWLLQNLGRGSTGFDFLFLFVLIVLAHAERKHIFKEVESESADEPVNHSSI